MVHHNGLVIDHAKAPRPVDDAVGMVPRGPEQGKGAINHSVHHQIPRHHGPPRGDAVRLGDVPL